MNRSPSVIRPLALAAGIGLALSLAYPAMAGEDTSEAATEELSKGEQRLAKLLEGRVAGEPVNCIRTMPTGRSTTIDNTAYVFGSGNTIYVQRTSKPERIDDRDTLVLQRFGGGSQLCRQDIATTIDPVTGIFSGAVFFEDFIPYTRADKNDAG